jgi:hypothetical protein
MEVQRTMSTQDQSQVRETAKGIIQRAIQDPAFADQLRSDPAATLQSAGLPEEVVGDFITNDLGMEAEVAGYARCGWTCIIVTCDVSAQCGESL